MSSPSTRGHPETDPDSASDPLPFSSRNGVNDLRHRDKNTNKDTAFLELGSSSWVDLLPRTDHVNLFRRTDFAKTRLGHYNTWGPALRFYVSMIFADSRSACIYWGLEDRISIYNEEFSKVLGAVHPAYMGMSFFNGFPELAEDIGQVFAATVDTRQTVELPNACLFVMRDGFLEETWWVNQFIALNGDNGEIQGCYNTAIESTQHVLQDRRRRTIDRIASQPPAPVAHTLSMVHDSLRQNPHDVPLALLYVFDEILLTGQPDLRLHSTIGVPNDPSTHPHPLAPVTACLETADHPLISAFRKAKTTSKLVILHADSIAHLLHGLDWCGFGEPSTILTVQELRCAGDDPLGFYVQAINPRRSFDQQYRLYTEELARAIESKWMASISTEHARLRERAAERRAADSEDRLRVMAKNAPLGFVQISMDRKIEWANDQFYKLIGHDPAKYDVEDLCQAFFARDSDTVATSIESLLSGEIDRDINELILDRMWQPPGDDEPPTHAWVLTLGMPMYDEHGKVKLIIGYVSDISHQKWAESVQSRNAARALQAKRQQEEFIDTTSHEMRNPLTAMTQLADGIARCLTNAPPDVDYRSLVSENVEAANVILACAAHQRRVIDDVLILSRLESEMLSITPVPERQSKVVADVVKMFRGECMVSNISMQVLGDAGHGDISSRHVLMDSSRLSQILINLLSNATKFVANQPVREITVRYGANLARPIMSDTPYEMKWMHDQDQVDINAALPDLVEDEERVYLYFVVTDTGPGMSEEVMAKLFKRFSQASSRTHIQYGGSGIGLYVCRQLAEKQGGRICVGSEQGEGSSFGFYIETRLVHSGRLGAAMPQGVSRSRSDITVKAKTDCLSMALKSCTMSPQSGHSLLLVEDNLINQRVLSKQLRSASCTVSVANHGQECLDVLATSDHWRDSTLPESERIHVEAVLLDWEMPVMNGLECCRRIRQMEASGQINRTLPIILITANVRAEQREQAIAAGVDMVIPKPFTVKDLLGHVRDLLDADASRQSSITY